MTAACCHPISPQIYVCKWHREGAGSSLSVGPPNPGNEKDEASDEEQHFPQKPKDPRSLRHRSRLPRRRRAASPRAPPDCSSRGVPRNTIGEADRSQRSRRHPPPNQASVSVSGTGVSGTSPPVCRNRIRLVADLFDGVLRVNALRRKRLASRSNEKRQRSVIKA